MPRATTAACEVMPPRVVRMPSAACMPWMSSGEVSTRTRMTFLPSALRRSPRRPRTRSRRRRARARPAGRWRSPCARRRDRWSDAGAGRARPDRRAHRLFLARDQPFVGQLDRDRSAALAVRLPARVCSIHSLPCSTGELEVLHVAVVLLERLVDARQARRTPSGIAFSIDGLSEPASLRAASVISCGVRMPATTSSPCALIRNSP